MGAGAHALHQGCIEFLYKYNCGAWGFLGAQRELNNVLSCLSIVCCKKNLLASSAQTKGAWQKELGKRKDIIYL